MGRWQQDAAARLERAAVELFVEQGFAETTVPQITARAGLTTRTFFRHFADKREVLFAGYDEVPARVAEMVAAAPAGLGPLAIIEQGLVALAETRFEGRRDYLRVRREVIRSDAGLGERDLRKLAVLGEAATTAFRARGLDDLAAAVAAQLAVTAFGLTVARWLDEDTDRPLADLVHETVAALRAVTAG
jgi:AcrR family transcriptional regulator